MWAGVGTLSRALYRISGDAERIHGQSDVFDGAIVAFALAYADQSEKDHTALALAVRSGSVKAAFEKTA